MDFLSMAFTFIGSSTLFALACYNATRGMVTKIGRNQRFFPKHYITVSKPIGKMFGISQHKIPRFLYCQCYITIAYFSAGPIELLMYYCNKTLTVWLLLLHYGFAIVNMIVFVIISSIFKKSTGKGSVC